MPTPKAQVNFRIDPKLLEDIQTAAAQQDISYTQWILNQCKVALGLKTEVSQADLVELVRDRIADQLQVISELQKTVEALSQRVENLEEQTNTQPKVETVTTPKKLNKKAKNIKANQKPDLPEILTAKQLGDRLRKLLPDGSLSEKPYSSVTITQNSGKMSSGEFAQWASERDPDGMKWQHIPRRGFKPYSSR